MRIVHFMSPKLANPQDAAQFKKNVTGLRGDSAMATTSYMGHVENGVIRLDENVTLPENSSVIIVVLPAQMEIRRVKMMTPRLANPKDAQLCKMEIVGEKADDSV